MARYVVANRRSGLFKAEEKIASRATVQATLNLLTSAEVIGDCKSADPLGRHVSIIEADAREIASISAHLAAATIVEPVVRRDLHRCVVPIGIQAAIATAPLPAGHAQDAYTLNITAGGAPLSNVPVLLYQRDAAGKLLMTRVWTDANGMMQASIPTGLTVSFVEPIPYASFWIMFVAAPPPGSTIDCAAITQASVAGGGWWHEAMNIDLTNATRGSGIKVGVIDTGCGPHQNLAHVTLVGAFVDGVALSPANAADVASHGSHTSGIIGARPLHAGDHAGLAAACDLFHDRVFKGEAPEDAPTQADIVNAIDALSRDRQCDLINMSFGGGPPSDIERDAIRDAAERGTLCICSAGNEAAAIDFPAAYPDCAAVAAIGKDGQAPLETFSVNNRPSDPARITQGGFFLATFSCFGPALACAAPGVGIVSTVPDRNGFNGAYMEMDGTSMASPAACAALAVILSQDAGYRALPRDITRTQRARTLLAQHCHDLGLNANFEGRGIPTV